MTRLFGKKFRISSPYGHRTHPVTKVQGSFHNGTDFATPMGTPVLAPWRGVVSYTDNHATGGITCHFNGENNIQLRMCHLSFTPPVGTIVEAGQEICKTGNTGSSTAPHLHLGVIKHGQRIDPMTLFSE